MNTSPVPRWAHGNLINKIAVPTSASQSVRGVLTIAQVRVQKEGSRGNLLDSDPAALSFRFKDRTGPTGTSFARC